MSTVSLASRQSAGFRAWIRPHRVMLVLVALALVGDATAFGRWDWVPRYATPLCNGLLATLGMLAGSTILGFLFAVPLGLAQAVGPRWLKWPAATFCTIIRGTPLLLQLWLLYYGLGALFPSISGLRNSFLWPYLRESWPYGLVALTISFAAYEGEVMRGAFAGVPVGELQAARAFGMSPAKVLQRIWLPRAIHRALPVLSGETILQLKSTPLVATITVVDLYGVISRIRQETFLTYEPLLLLAAVYMLLTAVMVWMFRRFERRIPDRL